ncbi:hypothetical protein ACH5RR_037824 [Cinchona calisaya]|uniref:Terpene synthase N-terminal domain-containing protein n=1 Tax=Cinchona calisaya TaxID=153742 RepID=A0ABD2Y8I8_9GENT
MEVYAQTPIAAIPQENNELTRRSANFHPSIWGEYFLAYATDDVNENVFQEDSEVEEVKEEIRKMQIGTPDKSKQKMELIDTIQRLGVSYHFENAIEALLQCVHKTYYELCDDDGNDLHTVALRFGLLRQQGQYVSCERDGGDDGEKREKEGATVSRRWGRGERKDSGGDGKDKKEEGMSILVVNLVAMMGDGCVPYGS